MGMDREPSIHYHVLNNNPRHISDIPCNDTIGCFFQIYRDRKVFSSRVFEVASTDLAGMGIVVISYTIKEVSDEVGYLKVKNTLRPYDQWRIWALAPPPEFGGC